MRPSAAGRLRLPATPQELGAVSGHAMRCFVGSQKRHPLSELGVISVARQQSAAVVVILWNDVRL